MRIFPSYLSFLLYNPIRKVLTDRQKVLDESRITETSVVLEIGAGNGFITEAIAQRAKKVYAIEIQAGMVWKLKKRIKRYGDKVEIMWGDITSCRIEEGVADVAIIYYSFHEISNKTKAVQNIAKALKREGIVSIYEPTIEVSKATMKNTINMFETNGFLKEIERDGLFTRFVRLRKIKVV